MNSSLSQNNYIVIPDFINKNRAIDLSNEFKKYVEDHRINGDSQVVKSSAKYDYISFLELLCEKTPEVSSIVGETVLPTYSYARVYRNGSTLEPHVDRKACEISITVNLDADKIWSIWILTPTKEKRCVQLNPGDAMLYLGCAAPHWREEFDGQWCSQVFLHYVRSRGPYNNVYFDKKEYAENTQVDKKVDIQDFSSKDNENDEVLPTPTPTLIVKPDKPTFKSRMTLDEYVKVFYNILPEETCDIILDEYKNSTDWIASRTGDGNINKHIRNCDIIGISQQEIIRRNPEIRQKIDQLVFESAGKAALEYRNIFSDCDVQQDSGYDLLKYEEGGYYSIHTDSYKDNPRAISCSFNLNDDYEGGEFAFFDREMIIKSPKGSVIVFPSNFMYPHEIMQVTKGTRYSIVTWFV